MRDKGRVLIIDDSKLMLYTLREILSDFFHVYCYEDVNEALDNIENIGPSLILLDLVMPKVSGFEAIVKIKSNVAIKEIPVVMMTAQDGSSDSEERSFELGAVDFIPKPFKAAVVLARVRTHVRLYEYQRELEDTSITDALTGIYNRRGFDGILQREWNRSVREKALLSLLMLDIDHFKAYNDNYGHQAGDNALHLVGQAVKDSLHRGTDAPARYGGEEFAVVLPGVDQDGAASVAENLLQGIRGLKIKHEHSSAADIVTMSIGVATARAVPSPEELIKAADTMLYQAKETGRNRYCQIALAT